MSVMETPMQDSMIIQQLSAVGEKMQKAVMDTADMIGNHITSMLGGFLGSTMDAAKDHISDSASSAMASASSGLGKISEKAPQISGPAKILEADGHSAPDSRFSSLVSPGSLNLGTQPASTLEFNKMPESIHLTSLGDVGLATSAINHGQVMNQRDFSMVG